MANWTEEEADQKLQDNPDLQVADPLAEAKARVYELLKKKASKYHSRMTEYNRVLYHSKKEADFALNLDYQRAGKAIDFWLRQVSFALPGTTYRLDFMTFKRVGQVWIIRYIEVKGRDLPMGKLKRKQVEELYGISIEVV